MKKPRQKFWTGECGGLKNKDVIRNKAIEEYDKYKDRLSEIEHELKTEAIKAFKEVAIRIYYEEMHPIKGNTAIEELNNREEKAFDEYLGKNLKKCEFPVLRAKVDNATAFFATFFTNFIC